MLTIEDIKANARLAHAEKRLTAQNPTLAPGQYMCQLRSPDGAYCCAIGASLPDDRTGYFDAYGLPIDLVDYDVAREAMQIAVLHDMWHRAALENQPTAALEAEFLKVIQ